MIHRLTPKFSPFFKVIRHNQRKLGRFGSSMRSIKRRTAKPLKFQPCFKNATTHEWRRDSMAPVQVYPDNPLYY